MRAESARFNVYCACDEREVRNYALELEDFDAVLRTYHGLAADDTPPRKLDIFMIDSDKDLKVVSPGLPDKTAGFYTAGPAGIVAVAVRVGYAGRTVFYHEYSHHFMYQYFPYSYPSWLVEGYAEYFQSAQISGQQVEVGGDAWGQVGYLHSTNWLPLSVLLTRYPQNMSNEDISRYYAESWLLTNYMLADPARRRQLDTYVRDLAAGKESLAAMRDATGLSIEALSTRLQAYTDVLHAKFKRTLRPAGAVKVSALPASADRLMLYKIRLTRTSRQTDPGALKMVRDAAAAYPQDAFAQDVLAKAELIWGDPLKADAAIERRLKQSPTEVEPLWLAALSKVNAAQDDPAKQKTLYPQARPYLLQAYKLDPTDYRVLSAYAQTRQIDPDYPTPNTLKALEEAHGLAPQVAAITLQTADALIRARRFGEAKPMLLMLQNDPHLSPDSRKNVGQLLGEIPAAVAPIGEPASQ